MGPGNEAMLGTQVQCKCSHKQEQEESDHEGAASLKHVEAANLPSERELLKKTTKEEKWHEPSVSIW